MCKKKKKIPLKTVGCCHLNSETVVPVSLVQKFNPNGLVPDRLTICTQAHSAVLLVSQKYC